MEGIPMADSSPYPLRLEGDLAPQLNRWLWLVKWALLIPHFILLFFLWVAFIALSVVALFAILFTGRYPRGIFDFNVGVLRGSWRGGSPSRHAPDVRLQRRGGGGVMAARLLRLQRARHRRVPAVHAG